MTHMSDGGDWGKEKARNTRKIENSGLSYSGAQNAILAESKAIEDEAIPQIWLRNFVKYLLGHRS